MSKVSAKYILLDSQSLEDDGGGNLRVKTVGTVIKRTASGLTIEALGVTNAMLAGSIELSKLADSVNIVLRNQAEAITGTWSFNNNLPTSSLDPTTDNQFCRKAYVDSIAAGLDPKQHCRVATTDDLDTVGNGVWVQSGSGVGATLTAGTIGLTTIDSIQLADGDRVLVKDQTAGAENGIYVASDTQAGSATVLTRATDFDGSVSNEVTGGKYTFVIDGTIWGDTGWHVTNNSPITVDTTTITWGIFSRQADIIDGDGILKTGNTLSVYTPDIAGAGLEDDGINNLRIGSGAAGAGLIGGSGVSLAVGEGLGLTVNADDVAVDPLKLIQGGDAEIDGDKLDIDFTPSTYTPDFTPGQVDDAAQLTAHLNGIDIKLGTVDNRRLRTEYHLVTAGDVSAGYFTLAQTPLNAESVIVTIKNGIEQLNKQSQNIGVAVPDFDVLNSNQLHINNTQPEATGLSGDIIAGAGLIIHYVV